MILEKVRKTIKRYGLLAKGDRLVVGVSGGPDSLALLYLLNSLKKEFNLRLQVAHLDHGLRKGSPKDLAFTREIARKLGIPFSAGEVKLKELAGKGSPEEVARNARLAFLFKVARENKTRKIALGHNLDDQAETVLMRLIRGSGLYGLSGILPKREIHGYQLIRPLIEIKRSEIEAYLKRKKLKPRIDPTNLKDLYLRNRIRNRLIPLLENEYNRNIKEVLSNTAEAAGLDYNYLLRAAGRAAGKSATRFSLTKIAGLHPAIRRLLFRAAVKRLKKDTRRLTFQHIREIEDLAENRPLGSIVDLPAGISVKKLKGQISFIRRAKT